MTDPSQQYDQKMRELYQTYLDHCTEAGVRPVPRQRFIERVEQEVDKKIMDNTVRRVWMDVWNKKN